MGNFLHRLGAFAYEHKWRVIGIWLVILGLLIAGAVTFIKPTSSEITIPGTEAQTTLDRYGELFPNDGQTTGQIVFQAPQGKTITDYTTQINTLAEQIKDVESVNAVITPSQNPTAISKDQTIAYLTIQINSSTGSPTPATASAIGEKVTSARAATDLEIEVGGNLVDNAPGEIAGPGEASGIIIALVVLLITLGSLVAAGLPILTALFSIGVSMAGLFSLSQVLSINETTPVLGIMLGLAVGIDYALFVINRYRTSLLEGYDYKDAAAKAIATAGNAVLFAAATVVIALSALAVLQIPFITIMGLVGAATVALAAIVTITLTPALLGLAKHHIFRGKTRKAIVTAQKKGPHATDFVSRRTFWYKAGEFIVRHRITALVLSVVFAGAIAIPALDLKLGLPTAQYAPTASSERKAYDLITKGFGTGANGPLLVLVQGLPATTEADKAAAQAKILEQYAPQVSQAQTLTPQQQLAAAAQLQTQAEQYAPLYQASLVADKIAALDDVAQATAVQSANNGTVGIIQVVPKSAPADQATLTLISYLRDDANLEKLTGSNSVTLGVTGATALQGDINDKLAGALPEYLLLIVGLSFILLVIAFRSLLIPVKATLGFLLSVAAMFGAMVAVFQWGWLGITDAPGPIVSFIPILAIGILFGLAMDYEFFLLSSIHEAHNKSKDAQQAVIRGYSLGSKVVTAAAIIMISVFAGFIGNHNAIIQTIGFGLAFGILIDAFVVRLIIVPAVMSLLDKAAWWIPKWLDRILPHISIEGEETPEKASKK